MFLWLKTDSITRNLFMTYYYSNAENVRTHRKWDQRMREKSKVKSFLDKIHQISYEQVTSNKQKYQPCDEQPKKFLQRVIVNFGKFFFCWNVCELVTFICFLFKWKCLICCVFLAWPNERWSVCKLCHLKRIYNLIRI